MKNTKQTKATRPATLAVDYAPEVKAAIDAVTKAATAFKGWASRGDGTILPQCVEATRLSIASGYLRDGRQSDPVAGSITGKDFAGKFGTTSSEVSFWRTLATAVEAGVEVGSDLWNMLALASGENMRLAKATSVAKVIREGGSVEAIRKAVEAERAERDRRKTRAPRPASEKGSKGSDDSDGIPVTGDPVRDALTAILALDGAVKRIPADDVKGLATVRAALSKQSAHLTHRTKAAKAATAKAAKAA